MLYRGILLGLSLLTNVLNAQTFSDLTLGMPHFKPYTYSENGEAKGSGVQKTMQTLNALPVNYKIKQFATYTDLIKALRDDQIQGFFLATKNHERDKYAKFSKPLEYNNWAWFTIKTHAVDVKDKRFKHHQMVGTVENTNTYRWLVRQGYQVIGKKSIELPELLLQQKIRGAFLAEKVFEEACRTLKIDASQFQKQIEKRREFSIYISKKYLTRNPNFMRALNDQIPDIN